jgi:uncharacterized membrane protein
MVDFEGFFEATSTLAPVLLAASVYAWHAAFGSSHTWPKILGWSMTAASAIFTAYILSISLHVLAGLDEATREQRDILVKGVLIQFGVAVAGFIEQVAVERDTRSDDPPDAGGAARPR